MRLALTRSLLQRTVRIPHYMGGCQNYGPFLGTLNIRCRIIIGSQKGTIILTTTHRRYTSSALLPEIRTLLNEILNLQPKAVETSNPQAKNLSKFKQDTTHWGNIGVILGSNGDNGKENGSYSNGLHRV